MRARVLFIESRARGSGSTIHSFAKLYASPASFGLFLVTCEKKSVQSRLRVHFHSNHSRARGPVQVGRPHCDLRPSRFGQSADLSVLFPPLGIEASVPRQIPTIDSIIRRGRAV